MLLLTNYVNVSELISRKFSFIIYQELSLYLSQKAFASTDKMMRVKLPYCYSYTTYTS